MSWQGAPEIDQVASQWTHFRDPSPIVKPQPPPPPRQARHLRRPDQPKYYGYSTKRTDGEKKAFFLDGEEIIVAAEGEIIKKAVQRRSRSASIRSRWKTPRPRALRPCPCNRTRPLYR